MELTKETIEAFRVFLIREYDEPNNQQDEAHVHALCNAALRSLSSSKAEGMEEDARRYRWLRKQSSSGKQSREMMFVRYFPEPDIDAAIDAAMKESKDG